MTTPDIAAEAIATPAPEPDAAPAGGGEGTVAPEVTPPARGGRRKKALFAILLASVAVFTLLTAWYLITRKPITQLPIPPVAETQMPAFSFAAYGAGKPIGVAVSPDGSRIYATQTEGEVGVVMFDGKGDKVGMMKPPVSGTDHSFTYLAVDPSNGDVYVSDRRAGSIYVYSADGLYRRTLDPGDAAPAFQPLGLTLDPQGNVYVADAGGAFASIRVLDHSGKLLRTLGTEGEFSFPNGVALDPKGNAYVADGNHGRLVVLDPTGREIAVVARGSAAGELGLPRGMAIDDTGHVYVVDTTAQRVQVYRVLADGDRHPMYLDGFGEEGTVDGTFEYPAGVAVDARGRVYVADWSNDRIQVWSY